MRYLVGVDIGGTFTDLFALDEEGNFREAKVPTADQPADGILDGLSELGLGLDALTRFAHGTTIATNALVQKTGASTAVVTTKGFRDTLEIRRTNKGDVYDLSWRPPRPLVERRHRLEIAERISVDNEIIQAPDLNDIERVIRIIQKRQFESVAIVFLHSYLNDSHERLVKEKLATALPNTYVTTSSEVLQEFREFERTATTTANAYVAPVVSRYLTALENALHERGFAREVLVMQSNGGLASVATARDVPARTVASGPAAGTIAMAYLAELTGFDNLVGLDIGGTTADVSVVWDRRPKWSNRTVVEFGLPVLFPAIDIVSIGAGGGTQAWIDSGGKLRMGPRSSGARPGPVCYGAGGTQPTSTDAQLVLGRLSATGFLGGKMPLYADLAAEAIEREVGDPLGLGLLDGAYGMIRIMTDNMMRATRFVSVERGYDPREFALCAFGGGGAMYAAEIARDLNIPKVIVPPTPGVFSAYGMLAADMVEDASRSVLLQEDAADPTFINDVFEELQERVLAPYLRDGVRREEVELQRFADVVYAGQTHAISVPVSNETVSKATLNETIASFHSEHLRRFRHSDQEAAIEVVTLRVFGRLPLSKPGLPRQAASFDESPAASHHRDVFFAEAGGMTPTPIYDRSRLPPDSLISGPAVIEQMDTTTVVFPGMTATVDDLGNLLIDVFS